MLAVLSVLDGLYLILTTRQRRPSLFFLQHGFENPCWTKGNTKMAAAGETLEDIRKTGQESFSRPIRFSERYASLSRFCFPSYRARVQSDRSGAVVQASSHKHGIRVTFRFWIVFFFSNVRKWLTKLEEIVRDVVYIWLALATWAKQIFFWNQLKCQLEFVMLYFTESRRFKRLIQRCSLVSCL